MILLLAFGFSAISLVFEFIFKTYQQNYSIT